MMFSVLAVVLLMPAAALSWVLWRTRIPRAAPPGHAPDCEMCELVGAGSHE